MLSDEDREWVHDALNMRMRRSFLIDGIERIVAEQVEAARAEERAVAQEHYAAFCGAEAEMARLWPLHEQYIADNVALTEQVFDLKAAIRDLGVKSDDGSTVWVTQHEVDRAARAAERAVVEKYASGLSKADVALARWEDRGPTSLTIALCVEALYDLRTALRPEAATTHECLAVGCTNIIPLALNDCDDHDPYHDNPPLPDAAAVHPDTEGER